MVRPHVPGMLVGGPEVMDMGSKGVVPLEFSWLMWWIDALLGPTGPGLHVLAEKVCAWQWTWSCCAWWWLGWSNTLDEHVKSVHIDAACVGAWVHQEVVELCPEMAYAVAAGK